MYFGSTAVPTVFNHATLLTATVPGNLLTAPGTVNITVQNPGGATSGAVGYTIAAGPVLNYVQPGAGVAAGSANAPLTLLGSGFVSGSTVYFGSTAVPTVYNNATLLTLPCPGICLTAPGTVNITVQNPGGATSGAVGYTIIGGPVLNYIATWRGSGGGLGERAVDPAGFPALVSGSTVYFGSTAVPTVFNNATLLTATVPGKSAYTAPGTVNITVQNPGGATSGAVSYTIIGGPVLNYVQPGAGVGAGSGERFCSLTLLGSGFVSGSTVYFGSTAVPTVFNNATLLTATVPGNLLTAPGTVNITVQNPGRSHLGVPSATRLPQVRC